MSSPLQQTCCVNGLFVVVMRSSMRRLFWKDETRCFPYSLWTLRWITKRISGELVPVSGLETSPVEHTLADFHNPLFACSGNTELKNWLTLRPFLFLLALVFIIWLSTWLRMNMCAKANMRGKKVKTKEAVITLEERSRLLMISFISERRTNRAVFCEIVLERLRRPFESED